MANSPAEQRGQELHLGRHPHLRVIAPVSLPPRGSWCNRQLDRRRARPALSRARRRPRTRGRARLCTAEAA